MKRTEYISVYLHKSERELISQIAKSEGKGAAALMRELTIAYCQKRISFSTDGQYKEEISKNQQDTLKILENLQKEMKEMRDIVEIDLTENIQSIDRLNVEIELSDIDKILLSLQKTSLFLDQICEITHLSPKVVIKALIDLKKSGKVDQTQDMQWRINND